MREIFFKRCIENLIDCNKPVVNKKIEGKADIVLKSFQLFNIIQHLDYYVTPLELKKFIRVLFIRVCGKKYKKCFHLVSCYKEFDQQVNKIIYYFSIDITKYIYGYKDDNIPSTFPCMNKYLSYNMPKGNLARTDVTSSFLLILPLVSQMIDNTVNTLSICFRDVEIK